LVRRRTPFEVWTGRIPKLHHLKVSGATAFVHVETRKTKLLQRGWEGRFVGHSIDSPAYLVWRPGTTQIFRSRDLTIFNELTFQPQDQIQASTNGPPPVEIGHLGEDGDRHE
ncbi:unnamed protein product, partial [Discosporangium mesarthrocarpum]